ncbi:thioredoxin family protein [Bacillus sp. AGMB 02131]|uniref:Thioredoxin family protein n=1 Tax=Peribacillus faecalis TaxID=2772559 RepID=A0A927CZE1_9BACI|nr:thioredoxin family protein [Peribacillus faecalis]MBD3110503.1 thioredoxin family protein [Peribacillus faecalis]
MKKLESIEQFNELKNNEKVVFLFSADWCPDCRFIEPFMPEVENEFSQFTFIYVDRDEFIEVCAESDVFGIPSFIAYEKGTELGRFVSKDRKTKEEIENFLKAL